MTKRSVLTALACGALLFPSFADAAAPKPTADEAYAEAKAAYQKLKGDEKRRKLRHHWLNVAKRFEKVAQKYGKSERAPEALFQHAELLNELSRFSGNGEDSAQAHKSYEKLLDGWPKHRLADDAALSFARMLADRQGNLAKARNVVSDALPAANDKKKALAELRAALPEEKVKRAEKPKKGDDDAHPDKAERGLKEAKGPAADKAKDNDKAQPERVAKADASRKPERIDAPPQPAAAKRAEAGTKPAAPKADVKSDAATEEEEGTDTVGGPSPAVADAIAKLARAASKPSEERLAAEGDDLPRGFARRSAPLERPAEVAGDEREPTKDEVVEPSQPLVASLAERLRDVRVGDAPPPAPVPLDDAAKARLKATVKAASASQIPLAQQLGLKVKRVIIDAGHGGHDTGAIGAKGTKEKDVALSIAAKLKALLVAQGLDVVMTREDDTFLALEERTKLANEEHGDLFISVHCNSAPTKKLRGVETYTLNTSSNRYAIRLAARENATTERGVGDLQYILADLATKANTGESSSLAERVQRSVVGALSKDYKGIKSLGTKEALFFVLLGARMPAILVETSFLSNPEEEERLADDVYQAKVAAGIAEAVEGFLADRNKLAQID